MKNAHLLPAEKRILALLGENIRLARMRRKLTMQMISERANITRTTLWSLEKGESNVSLTTLIRVLTVLGMADELAELGKDDSLGRKLQDIDLLNSKKSN